MRSEIRKDYIQEKYVLIAPHRGKRPHRTQCMAPRPGDQHKGCQFCLDRIKKEKILDIVGTKKEWQIVSIPNKFPAVTPGNSKAYGRQEIVIETPDHDKHLEDLPVSHIEKLFELYARRTEEMQRDKKIEYVLIFKNSGGPAGASIRHAHSQIFATEFLPPHLLDKSQRVQEYRLRHGSCVYCDVIAKERRGPRFVFEDDNVICFTPYASMHNYEIWILPKRHLDNVTMLDQGEYVSWAKVLKKVLKQISKLKLPYNFYFHQVVYDEDQHLYMKITPRGSVWAGVEIGSGLVINPITPEEAAKYYREAFKQIKRS